MSKFRWATSSLPSNSRRDRRFQRRGSWECPIHFRVDQGVFQPGIAVDVSSRGLGLVVACPIPKESLIQIHYHGDRLAPHTVQGRVVRCQEQSQGYRVGVRVHFLGKRDAVPFMRHLCQLRLSQERDCLPLYFTYALPVRDALIASPSFRQAIHPYLARLPWSALDIAPKTT